MNKVPPNAEQSTDIDQIYRRLSGQDPGRPGEWVRRRVQAYAAQQAAERAVRSSAKTPDGLSTTGTMPAVRAAPAASAAVAVADIEQPARKPWLIPAIVGGVVVVAAVGFFVVPKLMSASGESGNASPVAATQPEVSHAPIEEPPPPPSPQGTEPDATEAPASAQTSADVGDAPNTQPAATASNTDSTQTSAAGTASQAPTTAHGVTPSNPASPAAPAQTTSATAHSQPATTPVTARADVPSAPPPAAAGSPGKPAAGS